MRIKHKYTEVFRTMRKISDVKTSIFWYSFIYTISSVCATITIVFFSKIISSALFEKKNSFKNSILLVLILSAVLIISSFLKEFYENKGNASIAYIKSYYSIKLYQKITVIPYKYVEDSDFLDKHQNIFSVVYSYGSGLDGFCQNLFNLPANLLVCVLFIFLLIRIHILCVIFMFCSLGLCFVVSRRMSSLKAEKNHEIGISKRRQSYFYKMSHEASNGKEIRVFDIREMLTEDYKKELGRYIDALRSFYRTELFEKFLENVINYMGILSVFFFLLSGIQKRAFQVSDMIMYLQILYFINDKFNKLANNVITVFDENIYINLFFEFLDETDYKTLSESEPIPTY